MKKLFILSLSLFFSCTSPMEVNLPTQISPVSKLVSFVDIDNNKNNFIEETELVNLFSLTSSDVTKNFFVKYDLDKNSKLELKELIDLFDEVDYKSNFVLKESIEKYKESVSKIPNDKELNKKLGNLYYGIHDWENSIYYYNKYLELNPDKNVEKNLTLIKNIMSKK